MSLKDSLMLHIGEPKDNIERQTVFGKLAQLLKKSEKLDLIPKVEQNTASLLNQGKFSKTMTQSATFQYGQVSEITYTFPKCVQICSIFSSNCIDPTDNYVQGYLNGELVLYSGSKSITLSITVKLSYFSSFDRGGWWHYINIYDPFLGRFDQVLYSSPSSNHQSYYSTEKYACLCADKIVLKLKQTQVKDSVPNISIAVRYLENQ